MSYCLASQSLSLRDFDCGVITPLSADLIDKPWKTSNSALWVKFLGSMRMNLQCSGTVLLKSMLLWKVSPWSWSPYDPGSMINKLGSVQWASLVKRNSISEYSTELAQQHFGFTWKSDSSFFGRNFIYHSITLENYWKVPIEAVYIDIL